MIFDGHSGEMKIQLANNSPMGGAGQYVVLDLRSGQVRSNSGQRLNLALAPADVVIPEEIPTFLAGYKNFAYRGDEVSKVIPVNKSEDQYRTFATADAFRHVQVKASLQTKVPEIDASSSLTTYKTIPRLIGSFVPDRTESNAEGSLYRPRQVAAKLCKNKLYLDREKDVWDMLVTSGNWDASNVQTLGAAFKWNGGASSEPILDLQTAMEASAQEVTGIWFNRKVANAFLRHASVREHMRQMLGDSSPDRTLATVNTQTDNGAATDFIIPGFPPFHVASAKVHNESTGARDYILGNHTVLVTQPSGIPQDGEEVATTYTFREKLKFGTGFESREFRVEDRGNGGTMVVCAMADIAKMTANNAGGLILNCVQ